MQINFTQKITLNTSSPKSIEMNGAILFKKKKKVFWGMSLPFSLQRQARNVYQSMDSEEDCL